MATKVTFKQLCESLGVEKPVLIPCNQETCSFLFAESGKDDSAFCWVSKKSATTQQEVLNLLKNGQILSNSNGVPFLTREGSLVEIDLSTL